MEWVGTSQTAFPSGKEGRGRRREEAEPLAIVAGRAGCAVSQEGGRGEWVRGWVGKGGAQGRREWLWRAKGTFMNATPPPQELYVFG